MVDIFADKQPTYNRESMIMLMNLRVWLKCTNKSSNTVYREFFASGNFGENEALKVC